MLNEDSWLRVAGSFGSLIVVSDGVGSCEHARHGSPLVPDISERVSLQPLELELAKDKHKHLSSLEEVCRRPISHLRVEIERVAVSRARRIPPSAANYLASHTEDWDRPTLRAVVPKRILTDVRYDQWDIYENRVCVRLIDHLIFYLNKRIRELVLLLKVIKEASDYASYASGGSSWGRADRIFKLWGELIDTNKGFSQAEKTLETLVQMKRRVAGLMDSFLYKEISRRSTVGSSIRMTNIFSNDENYQKVANLWREWSLLGIGNQLKPQDVYRKHQDLCSNFSIFSMLLVIRALGQLRYKPVESNFAVGSNRIMELKGPEGIFSLTLLEDQTIQLSREGFQLLRIVPVVASLSRLNDVPAVELFVELNKMGKKKQTLLLYPAPTDVFDNVGKSDQLRKQLCSLKHDYPTKQDAPFGCMPVSPCDLGSVERVARALRWVLLKPIYELFPPKFENPPSNLINLGVCRWLVKDVNNKMTVISPPTADEIIKMGLDGKIKTLDTNILKLRTEHAHVVQELRDAVRDRDKTTDFNRRKNLLNHEITKTEEDKNHLTGIEVALSRITRDMQTLLICPVCATKAVVVRDFSGSVDGHFECHCNDCSAKWGTRVCGQCKAVYPVIIANSSSANIEYDYPGWVDQVLGRDVLAVPCRNIGKNGSFICPECNSCS